MNLRFLFFLLAFAYLVPTPVQAQEKKMFTISGFVKDSTTGESMLGAGIYAKETLQGVYTNTYGFYSLTLPEGDYTLVIGFLGYAEQRIPIHLTADIRKNISLASLAVLKNEVTVVAERSDKNVQSTEMGKISLDVAQIKTLPSFMGETDILKSIQLLPGVKSAGEGNTGYYVRGGGPDQNLILLDEAPVYNASHLFGFFSVFNADALQNVTLTKGGIPAYYGGRLASVLDIQMKEGNNQEMKVSGGIGTVSGRVTIEGPIKKDTSSFILSARRTFVDLFLREPFISSESNAAGNNYYFYDLNAKVNYKLSDKNRLFLSGYFGRDVFKYKSPDSDFNLKIPWGNATITARWNHLFNSQLFMNTSAIFTDYDFSFEGGQDAFELKLFSGITDYNLKSDFTWIPNTKHTVKFGANYIYHVFVPSNASAKSGDVVFDVGKVLKEYAHDVAVYVNDEMECTDRLKISYGLRYTLFQQIGPFDRYVKDPTRGVFTDTITYATGQNVKTYFHLEPRFSMRYVLDSVSSLKGSFTQIYQYIHLASMSTLTLPTDVWVPSSSVVKPQFGTESSFGYFRNFHDNVYESSVEVYYRDMKNQVEYADGALPENNINDNIDNNYTFGRGWSYGAEFFFKKARGRLNGWIGYTLAETKRQFDDLNKGQVFYAKYDRRHDVSVVIVFELNSRWTFGATWVYSTGNLVTLPSARYFVDDRIIFEYGARNGYRLDPYHRLDLSATIKGKKRKRYESSWNFSVFNVYNRANPYFIYFDDTSNYSTGTLSVQAKQVSLFPILPSVTYNFKF
jgi:hypothetical protein